MSFTINLLSLCHLLMRFFRNVTWLLSGWRLFFYLSVIDFQFESIWVREEILYDFVILSLLKFALLLRSVLVWSILVCDPCAFGKQFVFCFFVVDCFINVSVEFFCILVDSLCSCSIDTWERERKKARDIEEMSTIITVRLSVFLVL